MKKPKPFLFAMLAAGTATPAFAQYTLNTLAIFSGTNGAYPNSNLIFSDGTLYGVTASGGTYGCGIVYSLPVCDGSLTTLASPKGVTGQGGSGATGLILSAGTLYGTVPEESLGNTAAVFSVPVGGGNATTLATFNNLTGANPSAMALSGGILYGTTSPFGPEQGSPRSSAGNGTVFSVPIGGGNVTTLANFNGPNRVDPSAGGVVLYGGMLYGTTYFGGTSGNGTVFSVPLSGGNITTLASFNGTNGNYPLGGLLAVAGTLYGTTNFGGANGNGTVFSLPLTGGNITTLASFNGSNGNEPNPGLFMDASGNLYGTTCFGGANNDGTVFSVSTASGNITTLVSFNGTNGEEPGGLICDAEGNLFGTTCESGSIASWAGTVFELSPTPVPEAANLSLLALGCTGMLARRWRKTG